MEAGAAAAVAAAEEEEEVSGGALRNASSISASVRPFPRRNSRLLSGGEPWTCFLFFLEGVGGLSKKRGRREEEGTAGREHLRAGDDGKRRKKNECFSRLQAATMPSLSPAISLCQQPASYLGMHQERHGVVNLVLAQRRGRNRGRRIRRRRQNRCRHRRSGIARRRGAPLAGASLQAVVRRRHRWLARGSRAHGLRRERNKTGSARESARFDGGVPQKKQ